MFEPTTTIRQLSETLAERHGLEAAWINDAAKGFMPGQDDNPRTVFESDSLLVQVASPEYLLAMKLHSGRAERDIDDAVVFCRLVGYTTPTRASPCWSPATPPGCYCPATAASSWTSPRELRRQASRRLIGQRHRAPSQNGRSRSGCKTGRTPPDDAETGVPAVAEAAVVVDIGRAGKGVTR